MEDPLGAATAHRWNGGFGEPPRGGGGAGIGDLLGVGTAGGVGVEDPLDSRRHRGGRSPRGGDG